MESRSVDFVNVSLRIRPALSQDSTTSSCLQVISKQPPVLLIPDRSQTYHFDNIFTEDIDQQSIYDETVKPLVDYVKQGYSCTVFAYGQTGTGKTYTMGTSTRVTNTEDVGLIPRALDQFFTYDENSETEIDVSVSFTEIYNEKVFDLLQNNKPPLIVKGFNMQGFKQENVFNSHEAKHFLEMGNKNRHTAETKQNPNSSRSHAVFTIYCNVKHENHETSAKLNLVDLAGSESVKKTGNQGSTLQEGININKGLLCISQVMIALSTNANFIPYRQSIITTILQDSLNKKNFVSLIACINSNPEDCNETVQTLEFAHRVKKMKNKPEVSEAIMQYKKDNPALFHPSKTSNTPFKRPATPLQTPFPVKRAKNIPLRAIHEPSGCNTVETKSSFSMSISSDASNIDATHQNFSPIIKKYMNSMESSLMNKLETVIKNTLKRPTRFSALRREVHENTPRMPWDLIQNEVSRIVQNEIIQLTAKPIRVASSPIDDPPDLNKLRRTLKFDENGDKENLQNSIIDPKKNFNIDTEFKIPTLPAAHFKNQKAKRTPSISPIEYSLTRPRQSLRLASKRKMLPDNSSEESDISLESSHIRTKDHTQNKRSANKDDATGEINDDNSLYDKRRYSVRLAERRNNLCDEESENHCDESIELDAVNNNNSSTELEIDDEQGQIVRYPARDKTISNEDLSPAKRNVGVHGKRRYSKRLDKKTNVDKKKIKLSVKDTPAVKKLLTYNTGKCSPASAHTKHVLNVLNNGNIKQLEQLHSIGTKTAQQVSLFRELKGPLKKISDLSKMPGWHGKKFEKFVEQNFLKKELV